jgi:hypothetical protein
VILRGVLAWGVLMAAAILNGTVRVTLLNTRLGERTGHVVSSLSLCLLILILAWFLVPWVGPRSALAALTLGALWLLLTLAFEFGVGRFVARKPWGDLLADYDIAAGRIWVLVLVTTFLAPVVVARAQRIG